MPRPAPASMANRKPRKSILATRPEEPGMVVVEGPFPRMTRGMAVDSIKGPWKHYLDTGIQERPGTEMANRYAVVRESDITPRVIVDMGEYSL